MCCRNSLYFLFCKQRWSINNINILKGVNKDFEKEAFRLVKMMPDWIPGRCNGTLADVKINLPIKFGLK